MTKRQRTRAFECLVVNEPVKIQLRRRSSARFEHVEGYCVQCDQQECQYAAQNEPPCPLDAKMFADEIAEIEERKRAQRE